MVKQLRTFVASWIALLLVALVVVASCSNGPQETHLERALRLQANGDLTNAGVEIRAALSGSPLAWHRIFDKGLLGPDNNMVYDTKRKTLVVFGGVPLSNDIAIYEPATRRHQIMPTPGPRPPKYRFAPMSLPSEAWQDRGARRAAWSAGAIRSRRHH